LETNSPGYETSSTKTAAAFGVNLSSCVPRQSRPVAGSSRYASKVTLECIYAQNISDRKAYIDETGIKADTVDCVIIGRCALALRRVGF